MAILNQLKDLQVVSIVVGELENHLNLPDKDLAEFIINLANQNDDISMFIQELNENGGDEFPEDLVINLYQTIRRFQPKAKKSVIESDLKYVNSLIPSL